MHKHDLFSIVFCALGLITPKGHAQSQAYINKLPLTQQQASSQSAASRKSYIEPISSANLYQTIYNLDDLKVLESQKSFREFLAHAHDIRPANRDKLWTQMVGNMAEQFVRDLIKRKDIDRKNFLYIEQLAQWPVLKNDDFYQLKREQFALLYLNQCLSSRPEITPDSDPKLKCLQDIQSFWNDSRKNPETGFKIGSFLEQKNYPESQTWDYFRPAALDPLGEFFCAKPAMLKSLWFHLKSRFESDVENLPNNPKEFSLKLAKTMHKDCWQAAAPTIKKDILLYSGATTRKKFSYLETQLAYELLKAYDNLEQDQEDLFLTLFLLGNPVVGKTFNLAWARLKLISQDYKRRKALLSNLKKRDPLPDGLFAGADLEKREVIVDFISKHFPEYLDYYSKTCLSYLEGKGQFPHGNPTIHCREFFALNHQQNWVNQTLKLRYSGLQKQLKGEQENSHK